MIERTVYMTGDGEIFENEIDAIKHEREVKKTKAKKLIKALKELCDDSCNECVFNEFCEANGNQCFATWEF